MLPRRSRDRNLRAQPLRADPSRVLYPPPMQVSLVATPIWAMKTPPLTTAYLSGWLLKHGHDVVQLDWNIELFHHAPDELKEYWDRTHLHKWQDAERYQAAIACVGRFERRGSFRWPLRSIFGVWQTIFTLHVGDWRTTFT